MLTAETSPRPRSSQAQHGLRGLGVTGPMARTWLALAGLFLDHVLALLSQLSCGGLAVRESKADTSLVPAR